jgi:DNA-binding NarL/FixJ family response regulator
LAVNSWRRDANRSAAVAATGDASSSRPGAERDFEERIALAARLWRATPRELDVLRVLVWGDSNKEIALRFRCHVGSVERHVTSLLRKAQCDSRSRMIARFWTAM